VYQLTAFFFGAEQQAIPEKYVACKSGSQVVLLTVAMCRNDE
jgi:hypothetical protein